MQDYPKISVIVPVYNAEQYLNRCIDSILSQTFPYFELLLINDGSTDCSGDICDRFVALDRRIKVFHKSNGGVSSARNLGLEKAIGDWVTFVDADDVVYPVWLENFVHCLSKEADFVLQGFKTDKPLWGDNSVSLKSYENTIYALDFYGNVKDGINLLHKKSIVGYVWARLYKLSIIHDNNIWFDERFNYQEDEEFNQRYWTHCGLVTFTDKVGYFYNVPDWRRKYISKNNLFYLFSSMYSCSLRIYNGVNSPIVEYYLDKLTDSLLWIYKQKESNAFKFLKIYRCITGDNVLRTRLFALTKMVIYFDRSCIIADRILRLHTSFKDVPQVY